MHVLALDTSTDRCAVALGDGEEWAERTVDAGQTHSEIVLPMIDELLSAAGVRLGGLAAIAFGAGPGSFTGLRIACGVAQGLAWGAGLRLAPVGSLLALAEATGRDRVVVAIDARMRELYLAAYRRAAQGWDEVIEPCVGAADELPVPAAADWFGAGNAFRMVPELAVRLGCTAGVDPDALPSAVAIGRLGLLAARAGRLVAPEEAAPVYVRDRVARTIAERALASAR
jgi:tRNA threonylcarbamoyladenosine biosynthesis protein TsaB